MTNKTMAGARAPIAIQLSYERAIKEVLRAINKRVKGVVDRSYYANMSKSQLKKLVKDLHTARNKFEQKFDKIASTIDNEFVNKVAKSVQLQLKQNIERSDVKFVKTGVLFAISPEISKKMEAFTAENVSLIKSIPSQYFDRLEGSVYRAASKGLDRKTLFEELVNDYGITKRRAALIANDQTSKLTSQINDAMALELGYKRATWMHSGGSKEPRPTHLAMNGKEYKIEEGLYDPHERRKVKPGELIKCGCFPNYILEKGMI